MSVIISCELVTLARKGTDCQRLLDSPRPRWQYSAAGRDLLPNDNGAAKFSPLLADSKWQLVAVQCRSLDQEGQQLKNIEQH